MGVKMRSRSSLIYSTALTGQPLYGEASMKTIIYVLAPLFFIFSSPAYAYIGPGLGAGALATVLGVLLAILMLIVGIVWYPIKRLIRSLKSKE